MTNITRRKAIAMSGKALLALAASGPLTRTVLAEESESVSWERFLELCHELSESQFANDWNQETYTGDVQRLVTRLRLDDRKIIEYVDRYKNLNLDFPEIRTMHYEEQFMVAMLDFEAGEEIPLHDHPGMTGVICCIKGRTEVQHYDKLSAVSGSGNPLLRLERDLALTAGATAALTADRGNIHALKATEYTRVIDVFTPPYDRDRVERARYYRIDSSPYQERRGVFEAEESIQPV